MSSLTIPSDGSSAGTTSSKKVKWKHNDGKTERSVDLELEFLRSSVSSLEIESAASVKEIHNLKVVVRDKHAEYCSSLRQSLSLGTRLQKSQLALAKVSEELAIYKEKYPKIEALSKKVIADKDFLYQQLLGEYRDLEAKYEAIAKNN